LIEFVWPAGDDVLEGGAIEKFHGDESLARVFTDVVDRAVVRVVQRGGGAGIALEAFERRRVVGDLFGKKWEGGLGMCGGF
jgi:hypothetical protein